MLVDAESKGLTRANVDSVYLRGPEAMAEHERRNGYDLGWGPTGVAKTMIDSRPFIPTESRQVLV